MKVIVCALSFLALSSAGFIGGGGDSGYNYGAPQIVHIQQPVGHDHGYSHQSANTYKVIKIGEEHIHHHDHHDHHDHHSHSSGPQIIKIIESGGHGHGHDHGHSSGHGGLTYAQSQVLDLYGHKGHATVHSSTGKNANSIYPGGHVIEKGNVQIVKVTRTNGSGSNQGSGLSGLKSILQRALSGGGNNNNNGWSNGNSNGWSSGSSGGWSQSW
ncbi:hypothetical protein ACFFRR_002543 [Megaselia abdita]